MGEARFHPSFLVSREDQNRKHAEDAIPEIQVPIIRGSDF